MRQQAEGLYLAKVISIADSSAKVKARRQQSKNKTPKTDWGKRFLQPFLEAMTDRSMPNGRTLVKSGRILDVKWTSRKITAKVRRLKERFYRMTFELDAWAAGDWSKVIEYLASDFQLMADLQAGELPPELESTLNGYGLMLFPSGDQVYSLECNCLAWDDFCKHQAGLVFQLASLIDDDPLLLLATHGMERDKLVEKVAAKRLVLSRQAQNGKGIASAGKKTVVSPFGDADVIIHIADRIETDIVAFSTGPKDVTDAGDVLTEQRERAGWPIVEILLDPNRAAAIFAGFNAGDRDAKQ